MVRVGEWEGWNTSTVVFGGYFQFIGEGLLLVLKACSVLSGQVMSSYACKVYALVFGDISLIPMNYFWMNLAVISIE